MDLSLLVVGSENPRIRDFFSQVAKYARVSYLDMLPVGRVPDPDKLSHSWRWKRRRNKPSEATLLVPRRWPHVSASMAHWFCRKRIAQAGPVDAVVFTWPQLCYLAEKMPDLTRVYYCKDPFELWSWGADYIRPMETQLLNNIDAMFAISRLLTTELGARTSAKSYYLPNGFCDWFMPPETPPRPADLPSDKPIVGSVGQINNDYDWDYITAIAAALPEVRFCFLGKVDEPYAPDEQRVRKILATTPNILWLGWRKYELVPAYMRHCDILMNFQKADDQGNRRSPLRLYDYLTTDRPIISTGVTEAYEHEPHVHIAPDANRAVQLIREMLAGQYKPDMAARRAYTRNQSWDNRAREFLAKLAPIIETKRKRPLGFQAEPNPR
jgi:hypothetical protein